MIQLIKASTIIKAAVIGEKRIEEYVGRLNSATSEISIARMKSPQGWFEPGQCPEFDAVSYTHLTLPTNREV